MPCIHGVYTVEIVRIECYFDILNAALKGQSLRIMGKSQKSLMAIEM